MTQTVFGQLADQLGHARDGNRFWASPAGLYRRVQNGRIPIDQSHDGRQVGELVHLERRHGDLFAVGHIDDRVQASVGVKVGNDRVEVPHDLYWSATRVGGADEGLGLISVALVPSTARVVARPIRLLPGNLNFTSRLPNNWRVEPAEREMLERALETVRTRRQLGRDAPLVIHDQELQHASQPATRAAAGTVEIRSAVAVDVDESTRTIEVVIAPYDEEAIVEHRGQLVRETFSAGCFNGPQPAKIRVNRDHRVERTIGRVASLHDRPEGLVGMLKIASTPLGDESLALASEGILDASAGFRVKPQGELMQGDRRVILKAELHHCALTPDPAYSAARVLAVRDQGLAIR